MVARLLREAEQTAVGLLRSHEPQLDQLVDLLLERETVDGEEVYRIVDRPVPAHRPEEMAIGPRAAAAAQVAHDGTRPAVPRSGNQPG